MKDVNDDCLDLQIETLRAAFASNELSPSRLVERIMAACESTSAGGIWISRASCDELRARARALEERHRNGERLPLYGVPFAVKDNIDVLGHATTAACPAFAYQPARDARAVKLLLDAGAIFVGKTNMDQFATGLVGTRSPYGVARNAFNPDFVAGGSSSGSALAVTHGLVSCALGTDTAGSGRVPAALGNIVGLKPSRGLISADGVVPACRSLDCVSIFATTVPDAWAALRVVAGADPDDPWSRSAPPVPLAPGAPPTEFRFGVPDETALTFFDDVHARTAFQHTVSLLEGLGGTPVALDWTPFREAARLLYDGPWIAERLEASGKLLDTNPAAFDPVVKGLLQGARTHDARSLFLAQTRLRSLRSLAGRQMDRVECLVVPSVPTIPRVDDVLANPVALNRQLGTYTDFVNLLDLAALAVPTGFRTDGLPAGATLIAPAGRDAALSALGARLHHASGLSLGLARRIRPRPFASLGPTMASNWVRLAVVGAHLSGQPLNGALRATGAVLEGETRTAPTYQLYRLPNTTPPKPGLVRREQGGSAIALEIWQMPIDAFGTFVSTVPAPMTIGNVELPNGEIVKSFLCEPYSLDGAEDITSFGGWLAFLRHTRSSAAS